MIRIPDLPAFTGVAGATSMLPYWAADQDRTFKVGFGTITGNFYVWEYGAKGDGVTDDAPAIQRALDAAAVTGGIVVFKPAVYAIGSPLTLNSRGVTMQGAGKNTFASVSFGTVIKWIGDTSSNWININGDNCNIYDIDLTTSQVQVGGAAISIVRTGISGSRNGVERVIIHSPYNGIDVLGFNYCRVIDTFVSGFYGEYAVRFSGNSTYRTDNFFMTRVVGQPNALNTTGIGALYEGLCASIFATDCYFTTCNYGVLIRKDLVEYNQPGFSRWFRCAVENCKTNGYYVKSAAFCTIMNSFVGGCGLAANGGAGSGIRIGADCRGSIVLDNNDVRTCGEHGILLSSGSAVIDLMNPHCAANSQNASGVYSGIFVEPSCDAWSIIGGRSGGNIYFDASGIIKQAYGIDISTGCNDFVISGVNLEGNVTGAINDGSTGAGKIVSCVGYESSRQGTTGTVTPNGTGNVTINHGLSKAPSFANVMLLGDNGVNMAEVQAVSATTITARIFDTSSGADVTAGNFVIMWTAQTDRAG